MPKLFSFDIGHASIGWAVFETGNPRSPQLEGCGSVIFPADDCLASQRRTFRRQRRHIRSTRKRIARLKELLKAVGVLTQPQLDQPGGPWPWKLASRALQGGTRLSWPELWDVLRWYAHNRGYDGNRKWSRNAPEDASDTEKEKNACNLMETYGTQSMAETICAKLGVDPQSPDKTTPKAAYKTSNAAFPRDVVVAEVRNLLQRHVGHLPGINEELMLALCAEDDTAAGGMTARSALQKLGFSSHLPSRFVGGLLFGQAVPRFDNRIIGHCPITGSKRPLKGCREFYEYRWAMIVANIRVRDGASGELVPLTVEQRRQLTERIRVVGGFTASQLSANVAEVAAGDTGNVPAMMTDPNAQDALVFDPAKHCVFRDTAIKAVWNEFPAALQNKILGRLNRQRPVTFGWIAEQPDAPKDLSDKLVANTATSRRGRRASEAAPTWETIRNKALRAVFPSGRSPFCREVMKQAIAEVMAGKHPMEPGGVLCVTDERLARERAMEIDQLTNNHLIRHRLKMLARLTADMVKRYCDGDTNRVERCAIEVMRDLVEYSGKTNKEIAQELGIRLKNFKDVSAKVLDQLAGVNVQITASLIRKARVADDLKWTCPYTGKQFDAVTLARNGVDLDHVVPRSALPSDSLDSLVVTFPEVNRWKNNRTARRFIEEEQGKPVPGKPSLTIVTLAQYDAMVDAIAPEKKPSRFTRGEGSLDDQLRKWNRKQRMLMMAYEEKDFTPRDLTVTSHLVRLAARQLEKHFPQLQNTGRIVSLPGSVTGAVRKSWRCLGCLSTAAPQVMHEVPVLDASGTPQMQLQVRPKGEIRDITHLHHALDASVIGYAAMLLPRDGKLWEQIVTKKVRHLDLDDFRASHGWNPMLKLGAAAGEKASRKLDVMDLPAALKDQITARLAECRVVQHVPADLRGARLEQNTWRVKQIEGDAVSLTQRAFDPRDNDPTTGARKRTRKTTKEGRHKVLGLQPGKLNRLKGALLVSENYGVAILDADSITEDRKRYQIIPFHQVKKRIAELTALNNGIRPTILRNGHVIAVSEGPFEGRWRIFSIKNTAQAMMLDIGRPDVVRLKNGTDGHKINVRLKSLCSGGLLLPARTFVGD
jgi:hypothetical protein